MNDYILSWWLSQYSFSFRYILSEVLKYEGEIEWFADMKPLYVEEWQPLFKYK